MEIESNLEKLFEDQQQQQTQKTLMFSKDNADKEEFEINLANLQQIPYRGNNDCVENSIRNFLNHIFY